MSRNPNAASQLNLERRCSSSLGDLVLRFDRNLRCTYVNRAVEVITGANRETFLGRTLGEVGRVDEIVTTWNDVFPRVLDSTIAETLEATLQNVGGELLLYAVVLPGTLVRASGSESVVVTPTTLLTKDC